MTSRRLILSITLTVCLVVGIAVALFVVTFDINNYRAELENSLSEALDQPVTLGAAHMTPGFGLSLSFDNLVVGADFEKPLLSADRLALKVRLLSLLTNEVSFSRISLLRPVLRLDTTANGNGADLDRQFSNGAVIHALRILDGKIIWTGGTVQQPREVIFDHLNAAVTDLAIDQPVKLQLQTRINSVDTTVPFRMVGTLSVPRQLDWRRIGTDLEIRADSVTTDTLKHILPETIKITTEQPLRVQLRLNGTAAAGLQVAAELTRGNPRLHLSESRSLPLTKLALEGLWTAGKEQRLDRLQLTLDGTTLAGKMAFSETPAGLYCAGQLSGTISELSHFNDLQQLWLPPNLFRSRALAGQLQLTELVFAGTLSAWSGTPAQLPIQKATLRFSALTGTFANGLSLRDGHGQLHWEHDRLTLSDVQGRLAEQPLKLSGTLTRPATDGELDLRLNWTLTPEILSSLKFKLPAPLQLGGSLPFNVQLGGQLTAPRLQLSADLATVAARWGDHTLKDIDDAGQLAATLNRNDSAWQLNDGRLELPFGNLLAHGTRQHGDDHAFQIDLFVPPITLERLSPLLPQLAALRADGAISLNYQLSGADDRPIGQAGRLHLLDVGLSLGGVVADISAMNGTLEIDPQQLSATAMTARVGSSPASFDLRIDDLSAPVAAVDLRIPQIIANELIFLSPTRTLHDLDARLSITADSIDFTRVDVRLPAGTTATVTGRADWRDKILVKLDIEGDWADVDEIIGLWSDPHETTRPHPSAQPNAKHKEVLVDIGVTAHKGVFHNFKFRDATTRIVWHDHQLILHPLTFYSDPGFCTSQVIFENHPGERARLRVSGYGSGLAAETVYESLLQKDAPLSGTMRSGFYLDGYLDGSYIDTLHGGVSLSIRDGVLRRFKVLAKVFSLLNVSQIFQLQLPDMAREGMPYERLTASFELTDGVLNTKDLFIKSNAMNLSLIGDINLAGEKLDLVMGVKPLRTVDRIVTKIPLAGWILTGEEKALITAQFKVTGPNDDPQVVAIPITSLSDTVFGIFKRVFGLPSKVVTDVGEMLSK